MKKLYIIGNGFDIAHGLDTEYWDFRSFLSDNYPQLLENFEYWYDVGRVDFSDPRFSANAREQRERRTKVKLWYELENVMGCPNIYEMMDWSESILKNDMDLDSGLVGIEDTMNSYWREQYGYINKFEQYVKEWIETIDTSDIEPEKMQKALEDKERIQWFAAKYANAHDVFFVGRGIDYAVYLEGSLKLKEISYIHSEAYAAGELKHGTISLIEQGTLVIGVLTQSELYEKTISNMLECKSRGAYLMGLTTYGKYEIEDQVNFTVYVPKVDEHFVGSLAVIPLQLLGYYVSVAKGLDVDKPRNLAKSVTVE